MFATLRTARSEYAKTLGTMRTSHADVTVEQLCNRLLQLLGVVAIASAHFRQEVLSTELIQTLHLRRSFSCIAHFFNSIKVQVSSGRRRAR